MLRSRSDVALGLGAVGAMVLCCAAPVLIAGGALAAIGGFVSNPLLIVAGVILVLAAVVSVGRRRNSDACCAPERPGRHGANPQGRARRRLEPTGQLQGAARTEEDDPHDI